MDTSEAAAIMGHKGGSTTKKRYGSTYYDKLSRIGVEAKAKKQKERMLHEDKNTT